jgi:sugar phosphate isomerase/epimerase
MLSRRDLGRMAVLPLSAMKAPSAPPNLHFGLQSYIFTGIGLPHDRALDIVIHSMVECGLRECDLFAPLVEPANHTRAELPNWWKTVPLDHFRAIRNKFDAAQIAVYGLSAFPGATPEELARTFEIAAVLGARIITLSIKLSAAERIAALAEKRDFIIGIQGNPDLSITDPDVISQPARYDQALSLSKNYRISFDIGDATGGGYDSLAFVRQRLDRIAVLYLKDRRKDRLSVPWGEGDTPVKEVLRLVRDSGRPIRCYIDCDYRTTDRPADVKRSLDYAKRALA